LTSEEPENKKKSFKKGHFFHGKYSQAFENVSIKEGGAGARLAEWKSTGREKLRNASPRFLGAHARLDSRHIITFYLSHPPSCLSFFLSG
jgi:hypothetical protein